MIQVAMDLQSDRFVLPEPRVAPQVSLADALRLRPTQRITLAQSVGWPVGLN